MTTLVLVEGRDGAGKTTLLRGLARRLGLREEEHLVRLPRPAEDERQCAFSRYLRRISEGGIVLFDRSWYGRVGVERVMGFCSAAEVKSFYDAVLHVEAELVMRRGVRLVKIYLDLSDEEQARRLLRRSAAELTAIDAAALARAPEYVRAAQEMFVRTSSRQAPWHVVSSEGDPSSTLEQALAHVAGEARRWIGTHCSNDFGSSMNVAANFGSPSSTPAIWTASSATTRRWRTHDAASAHPLSWTTRASSR